MAAMADLRIAGGGQRQRDQRADQHHGDEGEELHAVGVAVVERERAEAGGAPRHHGVESEDAPAILAGRLVVEPALDDDEHAGDGIADHRSPQAPGGRMPDHDMQQRGGRRDRGQRAEGADMADPVDHVMGGQRAGEKADEIGRGDEADELGRHRLADQLDTDQRRQGPQRRLHARDGEQHRHDRAHRSVQGGSLPGGWRRAAPPSLPRRQKAMPVAAMKSPEMTARLPAPGTTPSAGQWTGKQCPSISP